MKYTEIDSFLRDFKKLRKKFPSLNKDLETVKKTVIELCHINKIDNQSVFELKGFNNNKNVTFWKIKKFACKSLKGRGVKSGIRIIYAYHNDQEKVVFLEIYFKGNKDNEDHGRIRYYLSEIINTPK